jgi:hypothetical protein
MSPVPAVVASAVGGITRAAGKRLAEVHLNTRYFSYAGLIVQPECEKFSETGAAYAADHCGADWNGAAAAAKGPLASQAFSHDELVSRPEYGEFTSDQVSCGVSQRGL